MASGLHKINTCVNPVVDKFCSVNSVLLLQIGIKTRLDVVYYRLPAIVVVHEITKTGCINHGQAKSYAVLDNIGADALNSNRFWPLLMRWWNFLFRIEVSVE